MRAVSHTCGEREAAQRCARRRPRPTDAATVSLQIIDEGEGIPLADLENIFDKFFRAQKGDHVRAGTGLGLAIARGFFEAMHGTITASNVLTFPRVSAT